MEMKVAGRHLMKQNYDLIAKDDDLVFGNFSVLANKKIT